MALKLNDRANTVINRYTVAGSNDDEVFQYSFMVLTIEIHLILSRIYNNELKIGTVVQLL